MKNSSATLRPTRFCLGLVAVCGLAITTSVHAQILSNNFSGVATGNYNGTVGQSFGSAILGNATGQSTAILVGATSGVNGTPGVSGPDIGVRSSAFADRTVQTSFSMYFYFDENGSTQLTDAFVGAGWATPTGADNVNTFNGAGGTPNSDGIRFQVGLAQRGGANEREVRFSTFARMNNDTLISGSPDINLNDNTWYQLSFDLTFNAVDKNFDLANLTLRDWGANGITGGSTVASMATVSNLLPGSTIAGTIGDPLTSSYAFFSGNRDRGASAFDNLSVIAVPEPATAGLMLGSLAAVGLIARRRRAVRG